MADNALVEKLLTTEELSNATYGSFTRSGVRVDLKGFFESKGGRNLVQKLGSTAGGVGQRAAVRERGPEKKAHK